MLSDLVRYPYLDPGPEYIDEPEVLFWKWRAKSLSNSGNWHKTFWYSTPQPGVRGFYAYNNSNNTKGLPDDPAVKEAIFQLKAVRIGRDYKLPYMIWTEGEKDAISAQVYGLPAFCHHGGAGKATIEQAHHLAGYKGGVVIVADRDDAGYADAYVRAKHCQELGLSHIVVRPADSVTNPGFCAPGERCYCDKPCPPANKLWKGVDLTDHIRAGLPLGALVEVERAELERAHKEGASYGYNCPPPSGYTVEEWNALTKECVEILRARGGFEWGSQ